MNAAYCFCGRVASILTCWMNRARTLLNYADPRDLTLRLTQPLPETLDRPSSLRGLPAGRQQ